MRTREIDEHHITNFLSPLISELYVYIGINKDDLNHKMFSTLNEATRHISRKLQNIKKS